MTINGTTLEILDSGWYDKGKKLGPMKEDD